MLGILPFIVLLAASLLVLLLGRIRSRLGAIWMISAALAFFTWAGVILLHLRFPKALVFSNWLPGLISQDVIRFEYTHNLWILAICWLALLVCVVFAEAGSLENSNSNLILTGSFAVSAITLLSLTSSSLLTFLLTWALIDGIEFTLLSSLISDTELMKKTIISFAFRVTGTFLVIAALAISAQSGQGFEISSATGSVYTLLLIGVGFRLGVLPLHLSFTPSESIRRTLGTLLRLASPLSAFALLIQLPAATNISGPLMFVAILSTVAAIYGAAMWATAANELAGRQYWVLSLAGIGMLSAMQGQTGVVVAAAAMLITVGGFLFVFTTKERKHLPLFLLVLLSMTGLPFTPYAGLWEGGMSFIRLIQVISFAVLILGTFRLYTKKEEKKLVQENWISFFSTAGLIVLGLTPWLTLVWSKGLLKLSAGWWFSLILLGLLAAGFVLRVVFLNRLNKSDRATQLMRDMAVIGARSIRTFFRFDWLYSVFEWFYHQLQILVGLFEGVLEGEGGILWALVFLALLASVLMSVGK